MPHTWGLQVLKFLNALCSEILGQEEQRMFAVIQTGGKQYKVSEGDTLKVEKLELEVGSKIKFDVLLTSDNGVIVAGNPVVKGVVCTAEVVAQGKGDKIVVYKYKPKKNYRRKQGHRQPFTQIKILEIK